MLKPLGDRIVIKALEAETQTSGGIILPETAQEKPQSGEVLAVGPGKLLDNGKLSTVDVQVGGISGMAPSRRSNLAWLGLIAMFGGALSSLIAGCVVGVLL